MSHRSEGRDSFMGRMSVIILAFTLVLPPVAAEAQVLRIATINIWSGLDYRGVMSVGAYEADSVRELRLRVIADELRALDADVIALQEANPAAEVASFLAGTLGYDYIAQRVNAGIKVGCLGVPSNLNEGLAILARKELSLEFVDVVDLSESFGVFGNVLSLHTSGRNIAIVARVTVAERVITFLNVHLVAYPPDDERTRALLRHLQDSLGVDPDERLEQLENLSAGARVRRYQVNKIVEYVQSISDRNVVVVGDFNAEPESEEILSFKQQGFFDAADGTGSAMAPTWDAVHNWNVTHSLVPPRDAGAPDLLSAAYDRYSRRIDYVFLNASFRPQNVHSASAFLTEPRNGLFGSDHYGLLVAVDVSHLRPRRQEISDPEPTFEGLPILTYDTDVGFGYGIKGFFLNFFGASESCDLIAFNSTKGERWYRFVFSLPDFELRQGTTYPVSLDLIIDYDKYLKNRYFGIGNQSQESDREFYTKEPLEIRLVVSKGFSSALVAQAGLKFRTVRNLNYDPAGSFATTLPSVNHGRSQGLTVVTNVRYDTRNSYIDPSRGQVVQGELEAGEDGILSDYSYRKVALLLQTYHVLFYPKTVLAAQTAVQAIDGKNLPIHTYGSLGGNRTLRGYPQDRFLEKTLFLTNVELRFRLLWRLGGVLFVDAGKVASSPGRLDLLGPGWKSNVGFGVRLNMETFIARADLGLSREGTGFYLNFGHAF